MNSASGAFFGGRGGRGRRNRFLATGLCGLQRPGMAAGALGYNASFFGTAGAHPAEREVLERQVREMEASLKAIRTRLDALAAGEKAE